MPASPDTRPPAEPPPPGSARAVEVVRSEEELSVERRWRDYERVRVTKRVVTEERTFTVPVRREELVIEHLPLADGALLPGPPDRAEDLVLTLYEEQVEFVTQMVPVENIRIAVERVTEDVRIVDEVRREQVDVEVVEPPTSQRH